MLENLKLSNRFILILVTVFICGAPIAWLVIQHQQTQTSQKELVFKSRLLLESMISVRKYTSSYINQYLKPLQWTDQHKQAFIKETAPSFAANRVFDIFRENEEFKNYQYKEAAYNPTNRQNNLGDDFEQGLIQRFRDNPDLTELEGPRERNGENLFFTARPITIKDAACLACHSTPDAAPEALLTSYGDQNGFGWQLGETVAVRMVYMPIEQITDSGQKHAADVTLVLLPIIAILAVSIHFLMRRTVVAPIYSLRKATVALGSGREESADTSDEMAIKSLEKVKHRKDEIGLLAQDFQKMADIVAHREKSLENTNLALVKNQAYLEAVMDNAVDAIISIDEKGLIQTCNPATQQIFGYSEAELIGQTVNILMPELYSESHDEYINRYINSGSAAIIGVGRELEAKHKDGRFFPIELSVSEMHVLGKHLFSGIIRDITERKKSLASQQIALLEKARAEAESSAKSSFLANMSHEIRTPLAAIIGYAEAALNNVEDKTQHYSSINTIIRNGKHLLQIINDILDLSKVQSTSFEPHITTVAVCELVADVQRLVELQAEKKGLTFQIDYGFPLPSTIESDALRLKQILINICNNAIKFTQSGSICVKVNYLNSNDTIEFTVIDTGVGLTPEQQVSIFEEYVQTDRSGQLGTGLGLPISKKLANKLGGDITVSSEPGNGSAFRVSLSNAKASDEMLYSKPEETELSISDEDDQHLSKLRGYVLVAEDNKDLQGLIGYYLNSIGVCYTFADNGEEAVEAAMSEDFDLILMDTKMPKMGGIEAKELLTDAACPAPIIMLSANAMENDKQASRDAGCVGFLSKPIERDKFVATLKQYLNNDDHASHSSKEDINEKIIQQFIQGLPDKLNAFKTAQSSKDWLELKSLFHQLKGAGGSFGFPALTDLAKHAEPYIETQNQQKTDQAINELENHCREILQQPKAS